MCWLSKHQYKEGLFRLWHHNCIQEGNGPIWFSILCYKLDVWLHLVDVLQELLFPCRIYDHKSVIPISLPYSWGILSCIDGLDLKVLHIEVGHNWADGRSHGCYLKLFKEQYRTSIVYPTTTSKV